MSDGLERGAQRPEVGELDEQRRGAEQRGGRDERDRVGELERQVDLGAPVAAQRVSQLLAREAGQQHERQRAPRRRRERVATPARACDEQRRGERGRGERREVGGGPQLHAPHPGAGYGSPHPEDAGMLHGRAAAARRSLTSMSDAITDLVEGAMGSPWVYLALCAFAAIDAFFPVVPSESLVITAGVFAATGEPNVFARDRRRSARRVRRRPHLLSRRPHRRRAADRPRQARQPQGRGVRAAPAGCWRSAAARSSSSAATSPARARRSR